MGGGFLHCDLKPSNVLLDGQGKPYVTDFGLARRTGEDSSLSISGAILGTPSYMAPEQATGSRARLGPATDVYGLGAILYELLTGRPPFRSPTIMETVVQVLERDPAPPRELRPEVPRELEGVCLKCLEKAPKDRYPSAEALAQELDNYLQGDGIAATGIVSRLRRWNRREPELVARLGGLGLMAVITQINFYLSSHPDRQLHWTIQAVLGLWAILSLLFQVLLRTGYRSDRVRVLWSAADIVCLTIELKLLEKIEPAWQAEWSTGARRDDFARGLPAADRGFGAMVAAQPGLDHHADGDDRLLLDLRRCRALMARGPIFRGERAPSCCIPISSSPGFS